MTKTKDDLSKARGKLRPSRRRCSGNFPMNCLDKSFLAIDKTTFFGMIRELFTLNFNKRANPWQT